MRRSYFPGLIIIVFGIVQKSTKLFQMKMELLKMSEDAIGV
jgi:hypothetical protein